MHFNMLSHDLSKSPGQHRGGPSYAHDAALDRTVYEGPPFGEVPGLVDELVGQFDGQDGEDPLVTAALAYLNLVMVHPFRDGNGRMALALQTLVLCRGGTPEPVFSSVEEWLGRNTEDYYRVLAATGQRTWRPVRQPRPR
jgi:Fic family protein